MKRYWILVVFLVNTILFGFLSFIVISKYVLLPEEFAEETNGTFVLIMVGTIGIFLCAFSALILRAKELGFFILPSTRRKAQEKKDLEASKEARKSEFRRVNLEHALGKVEARLGGRYVDEAAREMGYSESYVRKLCKETGVSHQGRWSDARKRIR